MPRRTAGLAEIKIDKISTGNANGTVTISHVVADFNNRMLVVGVGIHQGTISNVTYNGVALTKIEGIATSNNEAAELWAMVAPPVGTANVVVTKSGGDECMVGVWGLYNCAQTLPTITAEVQGSTSASSLSITSTARNDWIIDCISGEARLTCTGSGHISDFNFGIASFQNCGGAHYEALIPGAFSATWSLVSGQRRAHVAIVVASVGTITARSAATRTASGIRTLST